MVGIYLAIDQLNALCFQLLYIFNEYKFTGIAFPAEHALAEEYFAHPYSIQATNQLAILPAFRAMRVTGFMQRNICPLHFISYPGALLCPAKNCFTLSYYFREGLVGTDFKPVLVQHTAHD